MNALRLHQSLRHLATVCNDTPEQGVTRFSWSEADRKARAWLTAQLRAINIEPWTDGMGNIRARRCGSEPTAPVVLIGSHLDTVRHGGPLDGTFGVVAALEVLRSLHEAGIQLRAGVELIAFVEEEGSGFGSTCLGSKAITGLVSVEDLKKLGSGTRTCYETLRAFGLDPDALPAQQIDPAAVRAYLEVHIEQNAVLERAGVPLGVVGNIFGMRLHRLTFRGHSDHAASPMQGRRDPVAGFAEFAFRMEELSRSGELPPTFSCTVGELSCSPNVGIVIPDAATFTVDIRHVEIPVLEAGWARIETLARQVAASRGLDMELVRLSASGGVRMDPEVVQVLTKAALGRGVQPLSLDSGPAHDAAPLGTRVPAGLLFVPSVGGLSHCPQEYTAPEDLSLGAEVLEDAVRSLAG